MPYQVRAKACKADLPYMCAPRNSGDCTYRISADAQRYVRAALRTLR